MNTQGTRLSKLHLLRQEAASMKCSNCKQATDFVNKPIVRKSFEVDSFYSDHFLLIII